VALLVALEGSERVTGKDCFGLDGLDGLGKQRETKSACRVVVVAVYLFVCWRSSERRILPHIITSTGDQSKWVSYLFLKHLQHIIAHLLFSPSPYLTESTAPSFHQTNPQLPFTASPFSDAPPESSYR
jgi:hypothetical protein